MNSSRAALAAGLCLLVAAAFSGVVNLEFLAYDDDLYVTGNPLVSGGLRPAAVLAAFTSFAAGNWHPLTWLSHMADVSLFGMKPAGHHAVNAVIHAANAVLAFLALSELTGTRWRAALAAALFAVHPLRVESVAWVAERKDVLSACFGLASLWAWARFAKTGAKTSYWTSVGLFAAGLMAKPMLVSLPIVLVLLDVWPLQRRTPWSARLVEKWPFVALAGASCLVTLAAQSTGIMAMPLELRIGNASVAYVEYLRRVLWPTELAAMYPYRVLSTRAIIAASLVVTAVTGIAAVQVRRRPWLGIGWLWFALMLVPTLGLVQVGVQAFADRYTYLPFIGLALAAAFALGELAERIRFGREIAVTLSAAALALLTWQTRAQVRTWHDTVTVFTHAIDVTRSNWFAHTELGIALAARGELGPAREELEAALRIRTDLPRTLANLGLVLTRSGQPEEGIEYLNRALVLAPAIAGGRLALGIAFERTGRIPDAEAAYRGALADPRGAREARLRLARLLSIAEDSRLRDGGQAVRLCDEACRESPCDSPGELEICALAAMEAGRTAEAVSLLQRAIDAARAGGDSALAAKLEERMPAYRRGEPVRLRATPGD